MFLQWYDYYRRDNSMKRKLRDILDSDKQFIKELASTYSDDGVSTVLINGFDN